MSLKETSQDDKQQNIQLEEDCFDLKIQKISSEVLQRNDLIFYQNDIWRCESINMQIFQNLQSKLQRKIPQKAQSQKCEYFRIEKLELIPNQWKFKTVSLNNQNQTNLNIQLKGHELGLGPSHDIQVVGMRRFQELDVVKSQKQKGNNISYKVILCKTKKKNCYLIAAVDFLN